MLQATGTRAWVETTKRVRTLGLRTGCPRHAHGSPAPAPARPRPVPLAPLPHASSSAGVAIQMQLAERLMCHRLNPARPPPPPNTPDVYLVFLADGEHVGIHRMKLKWNSRLPQWLPAFVYVLDAEKKVRVCMHMCVRVHVSVCACACACVHTCVMACSDRTLPCCMLRWSAAAAAPVLCKDQGPIPFLAHSTNVQGDVRWETMAYKIGVVQFKGHDMHIAFASGLSTGVRAPRPASQPAIQPASHPATASQQGQFAAAAHLWAGSTCTNALMLQTLPPPPKQARMEMGRRIGRNW